MLHSLFGDSSFSNARVWAFLKTIDAAEAERCRSAGCPRCGGELHSASYPRKPHGLAPALRADARRYSLCCAACRRRVLPPSVRFFGRRFRVAPLFLVVSVLVLSGGARLEAVGRRLGIPVMTLRRWRRWWQETFDGRSADGMREHEGFKNEKGIGMSKSEPKILRLPEVARLTGLSKGTIHRRYREGTFPAAAQARCAIDRVAARGNS